jgi:hypothetical protein
VLSGHRNTAPYWVNVKTRKRRPSGARPKRIGDAAPQEAVIFVLLGFLIGIMAAVIASSMV